MTPDKIYIPKDQPEYARWWWDVMPPLPYDKFSVYKLVKEDDDATK